MSNLWTIVISLWMSGIWTIRSEVLISTTFKIMVALSNSKSKPLLKEELLKVLMEDRCSRLKDIVEKILYKRSEAQIMLLVMEIQHRRVPPKIWISSNYRNIYYNSNKICNIWKMVAKAVQFLQWEQLAQLSPVELPHPVELMYPQQLAVDKSHQAF